MNELDASVVVLCSPESIGFSARIILLERQFSAERAAQIKREDLL